MLVSTSSMTRDGSLKASLRKVFNLSLIHIYQGPLWADRPAWERNPFPSIEARRFLAQYTAEKAIEDWESPNVMTTNNISFIGAMVNLNQISKMRVKLSVVPMKLKGARGAPCSVIAEEI